MSEGGSTGVTIIVGGVKDGGKGMLELVPNQSDGRVKGGRYDCLHCIFDLLLDLGKCLIRISVPWMPTIVFKNAFFLLCLSKG